MLVALAIAPEIVSAQKVESAKDREPGDKEIFKYVWNNKATNLEESWTALTEDEMIGVHKVDGKEYEIVMARSLYQLRKMRCFGNGQRCVFSPGLNFVQFPLEKGKKWTTSTTLTAETFTGEIVQERTVEGVETLRIPAGEFETYKIKSVGHFKSKTTKGDVYIGKEEETDWVAIVSGKMLVVKIAYKNSFAETFSLDLISVSFK
jgi:hypothetical protein